MRTPDLTFARLMLAEAWRLLPARWTDAAVRSVRLAALGAVNGRFHPAACNCDGCGRGVTSPGVLELNERLFGDGHHLIDETGLTAPVYGPAVSRALHTTLHELAHAIGEATGFDKSPQWLDLSGWTDSPDDVPGADRYVERRPGWTPGPSPWRYRAGTAFCRPYSAKSPLEDFADCVTYRALGWTSRFTHRGNGQAKLAYINRFIWDDRDAVVPFQRSSLTAHTHRGTPYVPQRFFRAHSWRPGAQRLRRAPA